MTERLPWLLLAGVLIAAAARGDEPDQRRKAIDAELRLLRAQAERETLKQEAALLVAHKVGERKPVPELSRALRASRLFEGTREALDKALTDARRAVGDEERRAEVAWRAAAARKRDAERRQKQAEARTGVALGEPPAVLPRGPARTRLWLWSVVALSAGLLLSAYEARYVLRQRRRSASLGRQLFVGVVLLALLALTAGWCWRQLEELRQTNSPILFAGRDALEEDSDLEKELARLQRQSQALDAANDAARKQVEDRRDAIIRSWADELSFPDRAAFVRFAGDHFADLHGLLTSARTAKLLGDDVARRLAAAERLNEQVDDSLRAASSVPVLRAGLAAAIVLAALSPWLAVRLWVRRTRGADRCPRCLDGGRLVRSSDYVRCRDCAYRFPAVYRGLRRLCVLTHGPTGSGKTLWLLGCDFLLARRNVPAAVTVEPIESEESVRVDARLAALTERRQGPEATEYQEEELPQPLLFSVRDRDAGRAGLLLHLFDFAGEMTGRSIDSSRLRKRALRMDGMVVFLDPTWPRHADPRQRSVEPQRLAFERLIAELRRVRGAGASVGVPVAVCLTKLDLIPTQSLYDRDALPWLAQLRQTDRAAVDLALLLRRSRLVRDKLDVLFPGWEIVRALEANFGSNYLFFPLTPAGLDDDETLLDLPAGPESLRGRELVPFGVVEPILWLLHAHGYRVFE